VFVFHRIPCRELHCWFIQFIPKSRKTQCKNIAKKWSIHGFYFHPLTPVHSHAIPSKHRDGTPLQFSGIIISVQSSRSALKRWGRNTGNTHKKPRLYYVILCYILLYIVILCLYVISVIYLNGSSLDKWSLKNDARSRKLYEAATHRGSEPRPALDIGDRYRAPTLWEQPILDSECRTDTKNIQNPEEHSKILQLWPWLLVI